jgi:TatD DNase family protein
MAGWIDTHAHIYLKDFAPDREEMLQRAREAGVSTVIMPNIDHTSVDSMLELELRAPGMCLPAMGLHPCSVKTDFQRELYRVEEWLSRRKFIAIGEMGTDLYWEQSWWPQQEEAFRVQAKWAVQYDLPLIIHCRESLEPTLALLESIADSKLRGVFHCFTGSADQARRAIALGFRLGIGGVVTFRKGGLDKTLADVGLPNLILETDSPYLAPAPHRGKRNEPAYIPLIARRVSEIYNVSLEEVMTQTTASAKQLFSL